MKFMVTPGGPGGHILSGEHFFQASKFDDPELHEAVRLAKSAREAQQLCLAAGIQALLRLLVEPCQQTPRLYAGPSDPQPLLLPPAAPPGLIPDLGNHFRVVSLDPHKRQYYR